MCVPSNSISPSVGQYTPVSTLKTVVFPAPFGPINPYNDWRGTVMFSAFTAVSPPNRIVTLRTLKMGSRLFKHGPPFRRTEPRPRELAAAEQTLRPENHQQNQQQRVNDHAQPRKLLVEGSKRFGKYR